MPYEVEVTDEFLEWWNDLSEEEQEAVAARMELLERLGPTMRRPYSGEIRGSAFDPQMKEIVCDLGQSYLRILYMFNPVQVAILLLGGNKVGSWHRWYDENISKADDLYQDHLKELANEGLI